MPKQLPKLNYQAIITILVLILGLVVGYRQGKTSSWPWLDNSLRLTTGSVSRLKSGFMPALAPDSADNVSFDTFWEVWNLLERDYLETDKIQPEAMVNGAISGMTSALGDPYTVYLPPVENKRTADELAGAFYGIGIELGYVDNILAVVSPLKGTPAEAAGIQAGDLILHVKDPGKNLDADTTGWTLTEAVDNIRGEKGTQVTLTLMRQAAQTEPFTVEVKRGEIIVPSVELTYEESAGKRVAHLKLSRFGERTSNEWDKAVDDILSQRSSLAGVILDLRNNPGGYFDDAIDVTSEFVEKGVVVSQQGKADKQDFYAKGNARLANIPVEVLVNRGSASSSEIVAGALRDRKQAKLIGEKTFGKGTVQDRRELSNGGGIHITIARFLLPSGEWIHQTGIPVDIEVQDNAETPQDEVLQKAIETI